MDKTQLLKTYSDRIAGAKVVSFDVFDTLIHRTVHRPTDVFDVAASCLKHSEFGLMNPEIACNFAQKRIDAEVEARKRLAASHGTPEVGLEDIYDVLTEYLDLTPEQRTYLKDLELTLETRFCHPNPLMQTFFKVAAHNGRRVVLCSDMYLPSSFIEELLTACGFTKPYTLLVSWELRKSKHEGSMFGELLRRFSVKPRDVVHFGDNEHADVEKAREAGVQPELFNYLRDRIEPGLRMPLEKPADGGPVWSLIMGSIRRRLMERTFDFWEDIGLQVFGPLFVGNILWTAHLARQDRIERLLFFARDAYLPYQVFQRYKGLLGPEVELKYAYFSRAALLLPSFVDMPIDRVWHLFSGRATRSVGYHFRKLGMNPHEYLGEIKRAGYASVDEIVPNSDLRMFRLLNSLWNNILLEAKKKRPLPLRYVVELAEGVQRLGIVDIGWTGNMQGGFSRLLQLARTDYHVNGYYLGTFGMLPQNYLPRNVYRGYLVNENQPWEFCDSLINGGVELLEFALMAPHGTTLGYREDKGGIAPVLEENKEDHAVRELAQRVQKGAWEFIEAVLPHVLAMGIDGFISQRWADPFFRLVNQPTMEEADMLGELTHSDTASDTSKRLPIAEKLPEDIVRKRGAAYHEARERAYWKKAFDLRNGEPGNP